MYFLTKEIGNEYSSTSFSTIDSTKIKSILVTRPNHRLGNLLLITPLLQEIENTFPNAKVDVFLKGNLGPIILKEYANVNQIIALPKNHFSKLPIYINTWFKLRKKKYDLVINAVPHSSSGRLSTKLCRAKVKIFGNNNKNYERFDKNYKHIAKLPVCSLRQALSQKMLFTSLEVPSLDIKLTDKEKKNGKEILNKITQSTQKTIVIFTYATGEKCYGKTWWKNFYKTLKEAFPNYFVLEVLPKENSSQIDFSAPTYYSKDLREICSVLSNTAGFIGADSGMMHLAVASKISVIGLFSVTNPQIYQPYGRQNIALNPMEISNAEIIQHLKKRIH